MAIDFQPQFDFQPEQPTNTGGGEKPSLFEVAKNIPLPQPFEHLRNVATDVGENVAGIANTLKTGLYDIPKAALSLPGELAKGIVEQKIPETQIGNITRDATKGMTEDIKSFASHPIESIIKHPVSAALTFVSPGEESAIKLSPKVNSAVESRLGSIFNKLANIPERATQREGYKLPVPSASEIEQAVKNVQNVATKIKEEHGNLLNKAKENVGIPTTPEAKAESIRKYGNAFDLNLNKPLELPENFKKKAPEMSPENVPITPLKIGQEVVATAPGKPDIKMVYKMPGMMVGTHDPAFDLKTPLPAPGKTWAHPIDSTISQSTLESYGYKVPEGSPAVEATKTQPMPFKLSPHKNPNDLVVEIERFKKNLNYIHPKDRVKAASYLQDQINNHVDFTKSGDAKQGLLKQQYSDLKEIINDNSPNLQSAKSKMQSVYGVLDNLDSKLASPGKAEAFLKKLFVSKSPEAKDMLTQLAKLEALSGKPVVSRLFDKFAAKSFEPLVSRPGREVLEGTAGATALAFGHPTGAIAAGAALAAQSPKLLGKLAKNAPKGLRGLVNIGGTEANKAQLEAMMEKLKNAHK